MQSPNDFLKEIPLRRCYSTEHNIIAVAGYRRGVMAGGEMPEAIRGSYDTLAKVLKTHGLTFKNVVKENLYTTNLDAVKANQAIRRSYYGKDFPAATWVQVARLYQPEHVLEVELIAVFPE